MPSEGSDGISVGESEAVAHAQRGFVGFEAGVFQASPVVVAVAGVQGQLGRDVETDTGDDTETYAADAVALVMGVLRLWTNIIISCRFYVLTMGDGKKLCCFFGRIDAVSDVSVGDARTDIGFEFIVEFEIVNGGQAERRNGVERTVFLIFRLPVYPVAIVVFFHIFYVHGIFIAAPFPVTGIICGDAPAAEVVADRHPGVDGMRTDVSEIIAYRAYFFAFFWIGWFRIIVGNAFGGVG